MVEVKPIRIDRSDFDRVEDHIRRVLYLEIYKPILRMLPDGINIKQNASDGLLNAILSGRISYSRGKFRGAFSAKLSKELKSLGARWESGAWKLERAKLGGEILSTISMSHARFAQTLSGIDDRLARLVPEEIAGKVKTEKLFDSTLWKVDRDVKKSLRGLVISAKISDEAREKIANEYTQNLRKYIVDFTKKEILELRENVIEHAFSGKRYEGLAKEIGKSYEVTRNKAKFLARQETNLLMTKFKESRYTNAGVNEYRWQCVIGSPKHPVRPEHKKHNGKVFRWDEPPVTAENGARNNPGEDFNCRCVAIPIVKL